MDADTRHQLKQNELAEFLGKIVDFSDKRTTGWIIAILAIALAYAGYKFWNWHQESQRIQAAQSLTQIPAGDASLGDAPLAQLRQLISENHGPGLVALAQLKLAGGLEARGKGAEGVAKLAEAETQYKNILNLSGAPDTLKAPALYRLGILYETKRDFAQAREMYETLTNEPRYVGSPFVTLATTRIEQLDDLAVPVVFVPGNKPLPETPPAPPTPTTPTIRRVDPGNLRGGQLPVVRKPDEAAEKPAQEPEQAEQPAPTEPETEAPTEDPPATEPDEPEQP